MIIVDNSVPSMQVNEAVLFPFDDFSIPLRDGLELHLVEGKKCEYKPVIQLGKPGQPDCRRVRYYGSVLRIDGEFRMWYLGTGDQDEGGRVCYAVSRDGIHWEKPALGLVEYGGSTQNNLIDLERNSPDTILACVVLYDPEDPDPDRHFKMSYEKIPGCRCCVAFSPDGLRWKESPYNPVIRHGLEQSGLIKFNGCYYVNCQLAPRREFKKRVMISHMSYDFEHWTNAAILGFRRDDVPRPPAPGDIAGEQVHLGAALWERGNVIIGFYGMWHGHPSNDRRLLTMDIGLVVSNDATHFREPIPDFRIIEAKEERDTMGWEWDTIMGTSRPTLMQGQGFENVGDKTLVWYSAWDLRDPGLVRVATWPRDRLGYYSVYPGAVGPHFISCPLRLNRPGGRVFINADGLSVHSQLRVEVCDLQFRKLPGYSGDDCIPLSVSGFRQPITWLEKQTLDKFDHPIRVWVNYEGLRPEDAHVYAIYVSQT